MCTRVSAAPVVLWMAASVSALAYYGGRAAEAILTFAADADIRLANVRDVETLNRPGRFRSEAMEQIDTQVQHLMGIFQSETFLREVKSKGTIGETYEIRFTRIADGSAEDRKRVTYEFKGKSVFDKHIFGSDRKATIPIKLPLAADLIYEQAKDGDKTPCTDEHYNSEDDFWYFWDPDQKGCRLKGDSEKVVRTNGRLQRLDKLARPTYPEYDRLLGDNGNGRDLNVAIFFGYIDEDKVNRKPNKRDDAFQSMQLLEKQLVKRGFRMVEENVGFRETQTGMEKDGANILRRYEKELKARFGNEPVRARIQILLSDTSIDADQRRSKPDFTFHHYLIPAFKDADVLLYDGHSGLGANLSLKYLDKFKFDKDKYQVFFFNGCSTYPYYNGSYFEAKGGTKNLEVVTTGLPTLSDTSTPNVLAILRPLLDAKYLTYQTIMRGLEKSNKKAGTYLTAVNGDEDNEWTPAKRPR